MPSLAAFHEHGLLAQHTLAVVLEVGLQSLRHLEEVVTLALQRVEISEHLGRFGFARTLLVHAAAGP